MEECVQDKQIEEEYVDDRGATRRARDRAVNWWTWDRPDWGDVKHRHYRMTGTKPYVGPEIDAIILRIAPQLADDAMPIILHHDPHGFGGLTDAGGMVVMTVEKAAGTHLITFMDAALKPARCGRALEELVARVQAENPDVVVKVDGLLRRPVVVTRAPTDEEATGEAVNAVLRRVEEAGLTVTQVATVVGGASIGFDFGIA